MPALLSLDNLKKYAAALDAKKLYSAETRRQLADLISEAERLGIHHVNYQTTNKRIIISAQQFLALTAQATKPHQLDTLKAVALLKRARARWEKPENARYDASDIANIDYFTANDLQLAQSAAPDDLRAFTAWTTSAERLDTLVSNFIRFAINGMASALNAAPFVYLTTGRTIENEISGRQLNRYSDLDKTVFWFTGMITDDQKRRLDRAATVYVARQRLTQNS